MPSSQGLEYPQREVGVPFVLRTFPQDPLHSPLSHRGGSVGQGVSFSLADGCPLSRALRSFSFLPYLSKIKLVEIVLVLFFFGQYQSIPLLSHIL